MSHTAVEITDPRATFVEIRIGKLQDHLQVSARHKWRFNPHRHQIQLRMHAGLHRDVLPVDLVFRCLHTTPQIKCPVQVLDVARRQVAAVGTRQAQAPEIHVVRIIEHPGIDGTLQLAVDIPLLERAGGGHHIGGASIRQRKTVPAPVCHAVAGEGLQTGAIRSETKLAVTQRNTSRRVIPRDVMPCHQRLPVNRHSRLFCRGP